MFGRMGPWELALILILLTVYLVPTIIAMTRKTKHIAGIIVLNIFTGWTFLGWVGSLVWDVIDEKQSRKED